MGPKKDSQKYPKSLWVAYKAPGGPPSGGRFFASGGAWQRASPGRGRNGRKLEKINFFDFFFVFEHNRNRYFFGFLSPNPQLRPGTSHKPSELPRCVFCGGPWKATRQGDGCTRRCGKRSTRRTRPPREGCCWTRPRLCPPFPSLAGGGSARAPLFPVCCFSVRVPSFFSHQCSAFSMCAMVSDPKCYSKLAPTSPRSVTREWANAAAVPLLYIRFPLLGRSFLAAAIVCA